MSASLVLTVIGVDRPGIVDRLSQVLVEHEANWEESQMARLAGKFAGILLASVSSEHEVALVDALQGLESEDLRVMIESAAGGGPPEDWPMLELDLTGTDRAGIVREVTHALARRQVTIEAFQTERKSAPWDGSMMFEARAVLRAPPEVSLPDLQKVLEDIADDLAVEITLQSRSASSGTSEDS